jgi:hypothetical protein
LHEMKPDREGPRPALHWATRWATERERT